MKEHDESMDVIGYPCPIPMMRVLTRLKEMEAGHVLEIVSDQQDISEDVQNICERTNDVYKGTVEDGGLYYAYICKADR